MKEAFSPFTCRNCGTPIFGEDTDVCPNCDENPYKTPESPPKENPAELKEKKIRHDSWPDSPAIKIKKW